MNSPAHLALGLAVLGRRPDRREWLAIGAGAILPDLFLFVRALWRGALPADTLAALVDVFNSAPLYLAALAAGLALRLRLLWLGPAAALLHVGTDFLLHADDARAHLWPLTGWRFHSPVSFWDADHHGTLIGTLEGVLFAVCWLVILRRVQSLWGKALMLVFFAIYAVAFVHFVGHTVTDRHWAVW